VGMLLHRTKDQIFSVQLRRGPERSQLQQTHQRVRFQFPEDSRLIDLAGADELPFYLDLEPQLADIVVVGTAEGVEGGNICLGCSVAPALAPRESCSAQVSLGNRASCLWRHFLSPQLGLCDEKEYLGLQ
jgi:hypothetical protein